MGNPLEENRKRKAAKDWGKCAPQSKQAQVGEGEKQGETARWKGRAQGKKRRKEGGGKTRRQGQSSTQNHREAVSFNSKVVCPDTAEIPQSAGKAVGGRGLKTSPVPLNFDNSKRGNPGSPRNSLIRREGTQMKWHSVCHFHTLRETRPQ